MICYQSPKTNTLAGFELFKIHLENLPTSQETPGFLAKINQNSFIRLYLETRTKVRPFSIKFREANS